MVKVCEIKEVPNEVKHLFPRLGVEKMCKEKNFVLPRIVTADMKNIPCIKINEDHVELGILNEQNELNSISRIEVLPALWQ